MTGKCNLHVAIYVEWGIFLNRCYLHSDMVCKHRKSMCSNACSQMQKQQETAVVCKWNTAVFHWTSSNVMLIWPKLLDLEDMNSHRIIHCLKGSMGVSSGWNAMSGLYSSFMCFLIVLVNHHGQLQEFQLLSEQHGIEHVTALECNNMGTSLCIFVC
jgi:hypothetical protein